MGRELLEIHSRSLPREADMAAHLDTPLSKDASRWEMHCSRDNSKMRGRFIVFEGLDRSGKSTQVDNLAKKINENGGKAVVRKFPGECHFRPMLSLDRTTAIGKMIDAYLQNAEELDDNAVHLLFSANRWETV